MLVKALVRPLALRPCLVPSRLRERASNYMKTNIKTWMTCQVSDTFSADANPPKSGAYDWGGRTQHFLHLMVAPSAREIVGKRRAVVLLLAATDDPHVPAVQGGIGIGVGAICR